MKKKRIIFTVTNDLSYDQRMIRICASLANAGYEVLLLGRKLPGSIPIRQEAFEQKRLPCFFKKGMGFYAEFNIRLFFFLLFQRVDCLGAIDLDSILPCYLVSVIRRKKRIYDAHELFCEMKEVVSRPAVYRFWKLTERLTVPRFRQGYTVNRLIADTYNSLYGVHYEVVRNFPVLETLSPPEKKEKIIIYQGAVNEGRCFETLIPAMQHVDALLHIYGHGNFMEQARTLVKMYKLEDKVLFKGSLPPRELKKATLNAYIGVTLFENKGQSNYLSLGNRFADYCHAGLPQVCVNYPAYREINNQYHIAVLIDDTDVQSIAMAINTLLNDSALYNKMAINCLEAREQLCWQEEEKIILRFYGKIFETLD